MTRKSGIYTKGGDKGETALIGGRRVPKIHPRIEAYGDVDELMSHTTMLRDLVEDPDLKADLLYILDIQMATSALLAVDFDEIPEGFTDVIPEGIPRVGSEQVAFLESRIDKMDASLKPLHSFVIPGGHPAISQAHIARTVCRRTERTILKLMQESTVDAAIIQFYNRLSDYFFVVSRKIASILGVEQKPWKSML
ncbi:MAG: cob(I)yrinic acid a,c-diamide adenosyltransferase [Bacteroidales bacterium]|nr:cob(I)yrinic acid a,c-diamide adenosyltransferase [Bacteroidales bacterium]